MYRGLARGGGEIRFFDASRSLAGPPTFGPTEGMPLIEDSSGYANFRIVADGLDPGREMDVSEAKAFVKTGQKHETLGTCAMKRLKDYLEGPVGMQLEGHTTVAAVYFLPHRTYVRV